MDSVAGSDLSDRLTLDNDRGHGAVRVRIRSPQAFDQNVDTMPVRRRLNQFAAW